MGTKREPAPNDCYAAADDDEPMFTLLARDESAPFFVEWWASKRQGRDGATEQVKEAFKCAETMRQWRRIHRPPTTTEV